MTFIKMVLSYIGFFFSVLFFLPGFIVVDILDAIFPNILEEDEQLLAIGMVCALLWSQILFP